MICLENDFRKGAKGWGPSVRLTGFEDNYSAWKLEKLICWTRKAGVAAPEGEDKGGVKGDGSCWEGEGLIKLLG